MKTKVKSIVIFGAIVLIIGIILSNEGIIAQKNTKENKPNVNITVNKKTDKDGNITQYDSTYSYSWSGNSQNPKEMDSIFQNFDKQFGNHRLLIPNSKFDNDSSFFSDKPFLFSDSLFFSHHFGSNNNQKMMQHINEMMRQQEAMMNMFFNNQPFGHEPILKVPDDIQSQPQQKVTPKNQSYNNGIEL